MKIKFRLFIIIIILGFMINKSYSQLSVSYYSSSFSKIGLGYDFTDKFWSELRVYSNTFLDDITPELVVCYNLVKKEKHNVYIGFGANVNFYNGLVMPIGVQFTPIEKRENFSLHIEIQPLLSFESDMIIQSAWGLRYKFGE